MQSPACSVLISILCCCVWERCRKVILRIDGRERRIAAFAAVPQIEVRTSVCTGSAACHRQAAFKFRFSAALGKDAER